MPKYKLIYFDGRSRGETARLMFAAKGQEFEDVRVSEQAWPQWKPKMPFGTIPVLEVEGQMFAESSAINNYLARELGFYGDTNLESLAIDQITSVLYDLSEKRKASRYMREDVKAEMVKDYTENRLPKYLGYLEKVLKEKGTGHFVGSKLTLADIGAFDFLHELEIYYPGSADNFPALQALCEKIRNIPSIKTYLANRKETSF